MARRSNIGIGGIGFGLMVVMALIPGCGDRLESFATSISDWTHDRQQHAAETVADAAIEEIDGQIDNPNLPNLTLPDLPGNGNPPTGTSVTSDSIAIAGYELGVADIDQDGLDAYDRDAWPHWNDVDGDGCDARQQALIEQALPTADGASSAQLDPGRCRVTTGDWLDEYWGYTTNTPGGLDVDHIVPLGHAAGAGTILWTRDQREQFANDPINLWVVDASANRQKGADGPDQWRPGMCLPAAETWCESAGNQVQFQEALYTDRTWCEYSTRWAEIKHAYALTVTAAEAAALTEMQQACP